MSGSKSSTGTSIAAGDGHSIALSDNDLWIWGMDDFGQLGNDDNKVNQNDQVQVTGEFGTTAIPAPEINLKQDTTIILVTFRTPLVQDVPWSTEIKRSGLSI